MPMATRSRSRAPRRGRKSASRTAPNANRPARGRAPAGLVLTRARAILPGLWDCFYAAAGSGSEPFAAAPVAVTSGSTSGGPPATESAGCVAASPGALMPTAS